MKTVDRCLKTCLFLLSLSVVSTTALAGGAQVRTGQTLVFPDLSRASVGELHTLLDSLKATMIDSQSKMAGARNVSDQIELNRVYLKSKSEAVLVNLELSSKQSDQKGLPVISGITVKRNSAPEVLTDRSCAPAGGTVAGFGD
jgi:hypothetical protein